MKIKIEVPDETHSIMVRCFDDSGLLTNDYFVEHEGLEIIGEIDTRNLPSAQPDIIRCKECKHCRKVDESEYWCYGFCSPARLVRKDDFCSYGERKER